MKFKAELRDYYLANCKEMLVPAIAAKIKQDFLDGKNSIELSIGTIQQYLYTIRREETELLEIDDSPAWSVIDGKYLFDHKGLRKVFSVELIDQIHLYYTRRGYNFTRSAVQQRFKITPKTFKRIQEVFHLSKDSDIISPYTKQTCSKDELEALLEQLQDEIITSGEMTTRKMQQSLERKYRSVVERDRKDEIWLNQVLSEILDTKFEKIQVATTFETSGRYKEIDVNITDIHAGSKAEKMKITKDWSIEELEATIARVVKVINSYGADKVHINLLGDLVETVSGVNHPDSWKIVQDGHYGSKVIIYTYRLIAHGLIGGIANVASVNGVGGNHDRLQASNKLADTGATDIIFAMLKEHLDGSGIEVNYDPVILAFAREKYGVILGHGDKGIHKRKLADQILMFAPNPKQFQFVNLGHLHTLIINDSQHIGRVTVNPSIMTGNHYSDTSIGKSDKSGITINTTNIFGEPLQIIENV